MLRCARWVADQVSERFRRLHKRSHKLNVMLTVNLDDIAERVGITAEGALERVMQLGRNVFRGRRHSFAGFWRREIGTRRQGRNHLHILFHCPPGLMRLFARRLANLTGDPIAQSPSRVALLDTVRVFRGRARSWDLRRIRQLPVVLAYVCKVPKGQDRKAIPRDKRLRGRGGNCKEFRTFGLRGRNK